MIDKDLQAVYKAMIKSTYVPVIRRTIVILLIHDMDRMQAQTRTTDIQFFELIKSYDGRKALLMCLDSISKRRADIIQEILLQYGINTSGEMTDFYHKEFELHFIKCLDYIMSLVNRGRFDMLDKIARTQSE